MANKKSKYYIIPNGYTSDDTKNRLKWLKDKTGIDLDTNLENMPEDLKGIIENHIGYMKIPIYPIKIYSKTLASLRSSE